MQFPNAEKGIKKIFASAVLEIIGAAGMVISAFITLVIAAMIEQGSVGEDSVTGLIGLIGIIGLAVSLILTLIAKILSIVGYAQASKDEGSFKIAISVSIAIIAVGILYLIFYNHEVLSNIISQIMDLLSLIVVIYVIQGIINLAEAIGDAKIIKRGKTLFILITILYGLTCVSNLIAAIFKDETASIIASSISLVAELFGTIQLIIYIVFLGKAKKMLKNN
ncbi:MAG: hypothetical protein IJJ15_07710 [Ruminococcus sp.]|nr:hypothetical protein [Ruminococcus sp.]